MALRVLLADESTTIKKVMQLALQDFAVEVKAVHAGVDVLDVARSFQPDVIFADVLLQKKNGYEVCALLKADGELKSVPVVLMWSSFMDLDDQLAKNSGANGRLEKPFDVETLRKLVLELVPKTRSQRLAHFLEFPQKPTEDFREEESQKSQAPPAAKVQQPQKQAPAYRPPADAPKAAPQPPPAKPVAAPTPPPAAPAKEAPSWSMDSFDDPAVFADELGGTSSEGVASLSSADDDDEAFKPLELSNLSSDDSAPLGLEASEDDEAGYLSENTVAGGMNFESADDEQWAQQDLSRFKLDLPPVTVESDDGPENAIRIDMGEDQFTNPGRDDRTDPMYPMSAAGPSLEPRYEQAPSENPFGDLANDLQVDYGEIEEVELPEQPLGLEDTEELSLESSTLQTGKIPQVDAGRLEEIIRAQSRDIIEAVVRKIVPDLATAIIREELERLLEDTAVRESRKGPSL
jgi:CheY-like chemotaxis protein